MCAAISAETDKKITKLKLVKQHCSAFFSRIIPSSVAANSKRSMLKTDAIPAERGLISTREMPSQVQPQLAIVPIVNTPVQSDRTMQVVQNSLHQANQNLTVIESQQNLSFNNINGLQVGNTFYISDPISRRNSNSGSYEERSTNKKAITKSTIELMNSEDPIDSEAMRIAAKSIGENWRMVFRDLDIPDAEIAQIKEQYFHINIEEVIYQLLLRWQRNSDDISIGKLSTVLLKRKNYECFDELKKLFKRNRKQQANNGTGNGSIDT